MHPTLEFSDVSRRWRAGILGAADDTLALDAVSFSLAPGDLALVTGDAGSGKSTLLLLAAGRASPSAGTVRWRSSADPAAVRPQLVGARPWEYNFLTVRQALAFHADQLALADASCPPPGRFMPLMAQVGLRGLARVRLGQLGALDRFRVVVAQALLAAPGLLCCDEPFAYCGPDERRQAVQLLRATADRGIAVLVAAREAEAVHAMGVADRTIRLARGRALPAADQGAMRTVLELAVPRPDEAMQRLLRRLPSLRRRGRRLRVPLHDLSAEEVLSLCRAEGVPVRASRVAEERAPLPPSGGVP